MISTRLGSLNALEQNARSSLLKSLLGDKIPSADSIGRIVNLVSADDLRGLAKEIYARIRRNRIALLTIGGMYVLALDGHESHCSTKQKCAGCLERVVKTSQEEHLEYYHRHVLAILLTPWGCLLLDAEDQKPGEDEVATAVRLLERVLELYPRAFDIVVADGLYARATFFNFLLDHGKHVMAVLKNEERHLYRDAAGLLPMTSPQSLFGRPVKGNVWDIQDLKTWEGVRTPVRVIHSVETREVKRQMTRKIEIEETSWWWVTTAPAELLPTLAAWEIGHSRWRIENQGFNETVNEWHADHIYKHAPNAILCFCLIMLMAYNLFHVFIQRNLKPAVRLRFSKRQIARAMMGELFQTGTTAVLAIPP